MHPTRWLLASSLVLFGLGLVRAEERDEEWVRKRVELIRGSDTDAWRRIPWAESLGKAGAAAAKEGRPLFVFSHEGNIETGRC